MAQAWKAARHCAVWQWQKYSAKDHGRILYFHIMQHEMNVTNRCITNQRGLILRRHRGKEKNNNNRKLQKAKRGRAVTCGNITSDLMTTHLFKVFALHAELIAVWFSTDMHLHANAVVTNLSICPFSHGKENSASTTAMQKVTAMALVKRLTAKPRQLLPTTRAAVDFLYPCFTASRCKNYISGIEAATRRL